MPFLKVSTLITLLQARGDCIYRQKSKIMWQLITSHFRHAQKINKYCLIDPIFATKIKSVSLMGKQNLQAPHSKHLSLKH